MNKRPTLAQLLHESAIKAEQEQADSKKAARITEAVKRELSKRAETNKPMSCPHCGEPLPEGWRTDDVTSVSDENQDEDNEGDGVDDDSVELANRRTAKPMGGLSRDQVIASLGKIRC